MLKRNTKKLIDLYYGERMRNIFPVIPPRICFKTIDNDEREHNQDQIGIVSEEYLKGFLTEISSRVGKVCTIIEYDNYHWTRTEAFSIDKDQNSYCKKIWNCEKLSRKKNVCYCSVEKHLNILSNNKDIALKNEFRKYLVGGEQPKGVFNDIIKPNFKILTKNDLITKKLKRKNITMLEYNCPIMGFREILIKLEIGKNTIGFFSTGQIVRDEDITLIKNKANEIDKKGILSKEELKKIHDLAINEKKYKNLLLIILLEVDKLTSRLKRELFNYRSEFIREHFERYIGQIHDYNVGIEDNLSLFWDNTKKVFLDMNETFPVKQITVFASKKYEMNEIYSLKTAFSTSDDVLKENLIFHFSDLTYNSLQDNFDTTSAKGKKLFECLRKNGEKIELEPDKDFIRFIPSINMATSIAIWVRYDNRYWNHLKNRNLNYELAFTQNIKALYATIGQKFESIWSRISKNFMKNMLLSITHEVPQTLIVFTNFRRYISSKNTFNRLSESKIRDINDDFEAMIYQLQVLPKTAKSIITGNIIIHPEYFKGYKDLVYAWENAYRKELEHKKIKLLHPLSMNSLSSKGYIYADIEYIRQVMNNLYDNALKYCIRGSIIYTNIELINNYYCISIINYTNFKIPLSNKIYGIGIRTERTGKEHGMGFGLFLVDLVSKAHYGKLSHTVKKIADYNLPMIEEYLITGNKQNKDFNTIRKYALENKDLMAKVVARNIKDNEEYNIYMPTESVIKEHIGEPLYEITFTVKLAIKEKYEKNGGFYEK